MVSQYKIVLRLEEQALGARGRTGGRRQALGVLALGAQAGHRRPGGSDAQVARGRGGAAGTGARGVCRVGLAGRSRRGLGALLAKGLCTWCTQPVFSPV